MMIVLLMITQVVIMRPVDVNDSVGHSIALHCIAFDFMLRILLLLLGLVLVVMLLSTLMIIMIVLFSTLILMLMVALIMM